MTFVPYCAANLEGVSNLFAIEGEFLRAEEVETGLINTTWLVTYERDCGEQNRYILQRINETVFGEPLEVMRNVECVTRHINWKVLRVKKDAGGHTLNLYPGRGGKSFVQDPGGGIWRCYNFIEGCRTYDVVENTRQAYQAAHAFGAFQDLVSDLAPDEIVEVIPDFHNTPKRFEQLMEIVKKDPVGRAGEVRPELDFICDLERDMSRLVRRYREGRLPLRVTHNDTKINNVLFDIETDQAVCVIDLDTVMPGLSLYDFGDLVRTAVNPAEEDERDLDRVQMRMPIFEALVEGFLNSAGAVLTDEEVSLLAQSGKVIALELGMRFLADYLNGDNYFRTRREGQNLDRARTQLKLAEKIDGSQDEMEAFVKKVAQR
ncbi:MAG: aminoglycoside phosphotransferase family protein [Verrucomicrobiota bacterium JB023]|nr:aminoglycoside phosphotransferase family protein [Verrucomicrobiota bacterium JB023]